MAFHSCHVLLENSELAVDDLRNTGGWTLACLSPRIEHRAELSQLLLLTVNPVCAKVDWFHSPHDSNFA